MTRDKLRLLLAKLCSEWGYVLGVEAFDRLAKSDFVGADDFAVRILEADGCDPELSLEQRRKLKRLYTEFMRGSDGEY